MPHPAGILLSAIGLDRVREKNSRATENQESNHNRHERFSRGCPVVRSSICCANGSKTS